MMKNNPHTKLHCMFLGYDLTAVGARMIMGSTTLFLQVNISRLLSTAVTRGQFWRSKHKFIPHFNYTKIVNLGALKTDRPGNVSEAKQGETFKTCSTDAEKD